MLPASILRDTLQKKGVDAVDHGPNVKHGQVGVPCPFCKDDPSQHMTINSDTSPRGLWGCWRNKEHSGSGYKVYSLFMKLGLTHNEAMNLQERMGVKYESQKISHRKPVKPFTSNLLHKLDPKALKYLKKRWEYMSELNALNVIEHLEIGTMMEYPHRVILPVFEGNDLMNWVARACSQDAIRRYLMPRTDEQGRPASELLYRIQALNPKKLCIVEGPFDAISVAYLHRDVTAVSTFGCSVSATQMEMLMHLRAKHEKAVVWYDKDAETQAMRLSWDLDAVPILRTGSRKDPEGLYLPWMDDEGDIDEEPRYISRYGQVPLHYEDPPKRIPWGPSYRFFNWRGIRETLPEF